MPNTNETSISYKTSHDLRGPLINIQGFTGEVTSAIDKLLELAEKHETDLPLLYRNELATVVDGDLKPCLEYLNSAIALLEDRIRKIKTTGDIDEIQNPFLD